MTAVLLLAPAILIGLTLSASEPERPETKVPPRGEAILDRVYKHLDADGDGVVSRDEFDRKMPEVVRHARQRMRGWGRGMPDKGRQGYGTRRPWGRRPGQGGFRAGGPLIAEQRAEVFKDWLGLGLALDRLIEDKVDRAVRKAMIRMRAEMIRRHGGHLKGRAGMGTPTGWSRGQEDSPSASEGLREAAREGRRRGGPGAFGRGRPGMAGRKGLGPMGEGDPPPGAAFLLMRLADRNDDRRVDGKEIDQLLNWFRSLDRNDDKVLDAKDLKAALEAGKPSKPERPERRGRERRSQKAPRAPSDKDG